MSADILPVRSKERHVILDILRGIALLGIGLANFPEFSLYTFQKQEVTELMPTAGIDHIVKYLQYIFIDGKFYTLFSILFGIGFSIILQKSAGGLAVFYRRMAVLAAIGFLHLLLLWAGDILLLYALTGLLLPLFRNTPDKKLLTISAILIFFPVVMDLFKELSGIDLATPAINATQYFNNKNGITDDNFGVWLLHGKHYSDVLTFNLSGAFIRCREFIDGNRIFKVLGLFLFGLYVGRKTIYSHLDDNKALLKKIRNYGFLIGLPLSCLYAWNVMSHPLDLTISAFISAISVVPLSLAYTSAICLWYTNHKDLPVFRILAAPGRMALTNYIMQSVFGMVIFYGIGFGFGATTGLVYVEFIAFGVFLLQIIYSILWLRYFQFGPLEWVWRMLTYGKWLKLLR